MSHFGYLIAGYSVVFGTLAGYAAWVLSRRRALERLLPPDQRGARR